MALKMSKTALFSFSCALVLCADESGREEAVKAAGNATLEPMGRHTERKGEREREKEEERESEKWQSARGNPTHTRTHAHTDGLCCPPLCTFSPRDSGGGREGKGGRQRATEGGGGAERGRKREREGVHTGSASRTADTGPRGRTRPLSPLLKGIERSGASAGRGRGRGRRAARRRRRRREEREERGERRREKKVTAKPRILRKHFSPPFPFYPLFLSPPSAP